MKMAVTGGSGFIGLHAIEWGLEHGHEMWSFDRQDGNDILNDLDDLKGAEAVIHLAGVLGTHELFESVEDAIDINVRGAARIMRWCLENKAVYVGILMPDVFPSIYTATKIASKRISDALRHSEGLHTAHVRAFNAYGPGQKYGPGHPQKILPTFARNGWNGTKLPVFGSGNQTVDMVHAADVGRMLVDAASLGRLGPFLAPDIVLDAGTGVAITVNRLAEAVIRWTGGVSEVEYLTMRKGETETHIVAAGDGWEWLDWRPRHDMTLIQEAVEWYRLPR